jgi:hypothetical protein
MERTVLALRCGIANKHQCKLAAVQVSQTRVNGKYSNVEAPTVQCMSLLGFATVVTGVALAAALNPLRAYMRAGMRVVRRTQPCCSLQGLRLNHAVNLIWQLVPPVLCLQSLMPLQQSVCRSPLV